MFHFLKALHFIGLISWFSGLFYLGRLLIYIFEAQLKSKDEAEILLAQLLGMSGRVLKGIIYPAMIITFCAGMGLAMVSQAFSQPWFHLKFALVLGLIGYTIYCGKVNALFKKGMFTAWSSVKLRYLNEIATIFLVVMVTLGVFRQGFFNATVIASLIGFSVLVMGAVYRLNRR